MDRFEVRRERVRKCGAGYIVRHFIHPTDDRDANALRVLHWRGMLIGYVSRAAAVRDCAMLNALRRD